MKKINILLTIVIVTLFVACSKQNLKEIAVERAKKYIHPYDKYAHVSFSSDSICIIDRHPVFIDQQDKVKSCEYYIMWTLDDEPKLVEFFFEKTDDRLFLERHCEKFLNERLPVENKQRSSILRTAAYFRDCRDWNTVNE